MNGHAKRIVSPSSELAAGATTFMRRGGNSISETYRGHYGKIPVPGGMPVMGSDTKRADVGIDQVDDNIFIGDFKGAKDEKILDNNGITHIINAAKELRYPTKRHNLSLKLEDSLEEDLLRVLEPSYRYITDVIRMNPSSRILVHCAAGVSRSASIVIYYLMRNNGWGYDRSLEYLRERRPIVKPNRWFETQLKDIEILFNEK